MIRFWYLQRHLKLFRAGHTEDKISPVFLKNFPMNAGLLQTSYASFLEIQTHRNIDPLLRKQVVQLEAAQVIEKIGGRGGT